MPTEGESLDIIGCKDNLRCPDRPDGHEDLRLGGIGELRHVDRTLDKKTWSAEIVPVNGPDDLRSKRSQTMTAS